MSRSEATPSPSLEELAGAMLVAGFEGRSVPARLKRLIVDRGLGGIILFRRNVESPQQVRALNDAAQALAPGDPLLVCVDQEGGKVARFSEPFTRLPPARALGRSGDMALALKWGRVLGAELRQVGITLDLAPVMDVDSNPDNPVIADRALSEDPETVARMAMAIVLGMQERGVGACAKHFPGHGDTSVDSHLDLPVLKVAKRRFERVELKPFKRAAMSDIAAIMPGHLLVPRLDPERPASLSRLALRELLRDKLGFAGLLITDDLEMAAIADRFDLPTIVEWGLDASVDQLLFCHSLDKVEEAHRLIVERVRSGKTPIERLQTSYARIRAFKERFPPPTEPFDPSVLGAAPHKRLVEEVLRKAAEV